MLSTTLMILMTPTAASDTSEKIVNHAPCLSTELAPASFEGMKVHYNHVRKHDSINKTPAEAAGISTERRNKWKTIIQNSNLYLIATGQRV